MADKNDRQGDWMQTYTGGQFWPLDPRAVDINITDIAWGLAHINRYGGHIERPYSVAQHSVMVSINCTRENALYGLLHDAAEAYIGDIIRPLKGYLPEFKRIENGIMEVICRKYDLPLLIPDEIKKLDTAILNNEQKYFMKPQAAPWNLPYGPVQIFDQSSWLPLKAYKTFLARFDMLIKERVIG